MIINIKSGLRSLRAFDYWLAILVTVLSSIGVLMVGAVAQLLPIYAALPAQQRLHVITGVVVMFVVALIDYRFIARFYIPIYLLCVSLLIAVLIIGPDNITGTARWIFITFPGGFSLSLQPSEFAKFFLIVSLSGFIDRMKSVNHPLWFALYIVAAAVPVLLVMVQPSLSAGMVLVSIAVVILFVGGVYLRTIIVSALLALPVAVLFYFDMLRQQPIFITQILNDRQWQRIQTFLDPVAAGTDNFMQMERSLFAIGSGGLYGRGFMNNRTFVIHGHNDFVFAVAAEQFGFMGSMAILFIIGLIILKCFLTAYRATDNLGCLIAGGVSGMLLFEAFVNVAVVTGILPNTGMPFPFMSYGGTHMWTHMAAIGLVLNVGISRKRSMFESDD